MRSFQSIVHPSKLLKYFETVQKQRDQDRIEELEASQCVILECRKSFDIRFSSILSTLIEQIESQSKCSIKGMLNWILDAPNANKSKGVATTFEFSLKIILLLILDELTLKTFKNFTNVVRQLVIHLQRENRKTSMSCTCLLKIVFARFVNLSSQANLDLNSFIATRSDKEKQFTEFAIIDYLHKQTVQSIATFEEEFDKQHEYKLYLSDERKVELMIEENAEQFVTQFQPYVATAKVTESTENENSIRIADLKETIKHILKKFQSQSAETNFSIVKRLLKDYARDIQRSLGYSISVDVFIADIYHLLNKFCAHL